MIKYLILMIIAIVPITLLLRLVFEKDTIEKESKRLLFRLFLSGIVSSLIVVLLSNGLKSMISVNNIVYNAFIESAFLEEICKWIAVMFITWRNKEFNYKFDAIVYCVFVSLGFAFVENIGYCLNYGITTSLLRALIAVPGHAFFAIYMGYYLGIAKSYFNKGRKSDGFIYIGYSTIVPVLLHGIYNYCLLGQNNGLYILFILFITTLYVISFQTLNLSSTMDIALEQNEGI